MDQPTPLATPEPKLYIPPTSLTTPPVPSAPVQPPARKSKIGLVIALVIAGIIIVGGGAYAAAYFGYVTSPVPLPGVSNNIIAKSLDGLYNTTASEATENFSLTIAPRDPNIPPLLTNTSSSANTNLPGLGEAGLGASAPFDLIPDNLHVTATTTGYSERTSGLGNGRATLQFQAKAGATQALGNIEVRLLNKTLYLAIHSLSGIPFLDASKVKDQWFSLDLSSAAAAVSNTNQTSEKDLADARQTVEQALTLAQKYKLFTTKQNFGSDVIGGVTTKHTSHSLNTKEVVPFLTAWVELRKKAGQDTAPFSDALDQLKKPENQATLDRVAKALTVELWYDGKAKLVKQSRMTMVIVPPANVDKLKNSELVATITTTLNSYGKKQSIETPTGAKPFESLMTDVLNVNGLGLTGIPAVPAEPSTSTNTNTNQSANLNVSGNLNTNVATTKKDTDGDGVTDEVEEVCGTKIDAKDSDGDGYDDLTEIKNGYNPLGAGKANDTGCKTYFDLYN